jgi:hypothetical protein
MASRVVFEDRARVPSLRDRKAAISPDGRRIAWSRGATAWTRDLETGEEGTIDLGSSVIANGSALDGGAEQLAICTLKGLELWNVRRSRLIWRRDSSELNHCAPSFAVDQRAIIARLPGAGSVVLDARTGETLFRLLSSNDTNRRWTSIVLPDLRHQILEDRETWSVVPLVAPDPLSPAAALSATLKRTGLRLDGTELAAAP